MVPPDFLSQGRQLSTAPAGDASFISERKRLRQALKSARAALGSEQRWQKAVQACTGLALSASFRKAHSVAIYLPVGAECSTLPLMLSSNRIDRTIYYPVLVPGWRGHLLFAPAHEGTEWRENSFGIPEPTPGGNTCLTAARYLDLVVLPLVGFDDAGNRLGMGAGYYDQCLEFRRHRRHWRGPLLVGLAFDCQRADRIPAQPWDIPLDGIATESGFTLFRAGH